MLIKIIGNGFGAQALKYFIKQHIPNAKLVTYIPQKRILVSIKFQRNLYNMKQLSDPSRSWGGLLCMKYEDVRALTDLGIDLGTVKGMSSEDQNAYIKVNPKSFLGKFSISDVEYKFLPLDFLTNDDVKEELQNAEEGPVYVCLGALLTPLFLARGEIEARRYCCFDNKMTFRDRIENNIEKIDYTSDAFQFVADRLIGGDLGHSVSLRRRVSFRDGAGGAKAYYNIMSKGVLRHILSIINPMTSHSLNDLKYSFSILEHQIDVTSNMRRQSYRFSDSRIVLDHDLPKHCVNAFHYHNSVSFEKEKEFNDLNVYVSDAATLRDLKGVNPVGSIIAQSARKAMNLIGK